MHQVGQEYIHECEEVHLLLIVLLLHQYHDNVSGHHDHQTTTILCSGNHLASAVFYYWNIYDRVQDIFSAIAISTEIPQKTILAITRPFRQTESLIDSYLIKLIASQFLYQGFVTVLMLFITPFVFGVEYIICIIYNRPSQAHNINEIGSEYQPEFAVHFTIIYHLTAMF